MQNNTMIAIDCCLTSHVRYYSYI